MFTIESRKEKIELLNEIKQELVHLFSSHKGKKFSFSQIKKTLENTDSSLSEKTDDLKQALKELFKEKKIESKRIDSLRLFYIDKPSFAKNVGTNILILFITILIIFTIGEVAMRIKYADSGIFENRYDKMQNDLYKKLTDVTNPNRFMYGQSPRWGFDPNLGLIPNPGYAYNVPFDLKINETHIAKAVVRADNMNAQGMRQMNDVELVKQKGKYRIALLGDSFTVGDDVQTKHSFASELTEVIPNAEVVNVGMSGKSISYMYAAFVKKAEQYNPDMTVMNVLVDDLVRDGNGAPVFQQPYVFVNDSDELEISNEHIFSYEDFLKQYKPPIMKSYFITYLKAKLETVNYKETVKEYNMDMFGRIVEDLYNRTNGKFMVTLFLGWKPILDHNEYKYELYEAAKAVLDEKHIPYFDAEPFFREEVKKYIAEYSPQAVVDVFYQGIDERGHFSQIGYATFANEIKNTLVADGFYNGTTLNPNKFIYVPQQQVVVFLDNNSDIFHYVTAYDVIKVVHV